MGGFHHPCFTEKLNPWLSTAEELGQRIAHMSWDTSLGPFTAADDRTFQARTPCVLRFGNDLGALSRCRNAGSPIMLASLLASTAVRVAMNTRRCFNAALFLNQAGHRHRAADLFGSEKALETLTPK